MLDTLKLYSERRLLFVFAMGFASGLPLLLTMGTLQIWMTEVGVSLTAVGLFALTGTPYTLKFLWAPLIDRVPVPLLTRRLGRRRSWMLVIQLGLMGAIFGLGLSDPAAGPVYTAAFALTVAFFSASQDIVIDAYRIEILDPSQQGAGAAMTQAGYRFGLIAAGAGALYLADIVADWSIVYAVMALLVLVGMAAALLAPVPPDSLQSGAAETHAQPMLRSIVIEPFREFLTRHSLPAALAILAFILLYKFGDAFAGSMANPFFVNIGFSKIEIANASKIFGVFATLGGVFLGGVLVKQYGVLNTLLWCGILQMLSNLMFAALAIVGHDVGFLYLTVGIENFTGGMASSAFVAYLSLLCNTAYTGTQFALLTSFMAFGRTWLSTTSGWLADHTDWVTFFVVSTVIALPGLLLLLWMNKHLPLEQQVHKPAV
jgi:PAT family beta-lactamase induction signal transducer AmpG